MRRFDFAWTLGVAACLAAAGCAPVSPVTPGGPSASPTGLPSAEPSAAPTVAPTPVASAATGFSLTGTVLDLDRVALAGVTVTAQQGDTVVATVQTAADGTYVLSLPAGAYRIEASKAGLTRRSQAITLSGTAKLDFGPTTNDATNPFWLSDTPEIDHVDVEEGGIGGPLTLRVHLSEPITAAGQAEFDQRFELRSGRSATFIENDRLNIIDAKPVRTWDAAGQVYTFVYPGPYLASGAAVQEYTLALKQDELDTKDPETQEQNLEATVIADAAGNKMGRGKLRSAFKKPELFPPSIEQLTERQFGYLTQDRRWNLSHDGTFTFSAKQDDVPPVLERVSVDSASRNATYDEMTLTFSEPMMVARDRTRIEWTQLKKELPFMVVNVSRSKTGTTFESLATDGRVRELRFDPSDHRIVYLQFSRGLFEDFERVEVTLTPDAKDPAGNAPDITRNKVVGTVI